MVRNSFGINAHNVIKMEYQDGNDRLSE